MGNSRGRDTKIRRQVLLLIVLAGLGVLAALALGRSDPRPVAAAQPRAPAPAAVRALGEAEAPAVTYVVSGTITDVGAGWPLYARVAVSGAASATVWTDAATGLYSATLASGSYTLTIAPVSPGYLATGRPITVTTGNQRQDFSLSADLAACTAPGYFFYKEGFESGNGGYATSGTTSFQWGVPTSGPGTAHSGTKAWATNLAGNYGNSESGYLTSPPIDLTSSAGSGSMLYWWQWLQSESGYDKAYVEVSKNGGSTWTSVYARTGSVTPWTAASVYLDASYATTSFRLRFGFISDGYFDDAGWYVDDVSITRAGDCRAVPGGLLVGSVADAIVGTPLTGTAISGPTGTAIALATGDPRGPDAHYALFAPAGAGTFSATVEGYAPQALTATVPLSGAVRLDFAPRATGTHKITGAVFDPVAGWPLYARVTASDAASATVYSDPATGVYSLTLPAGDIYTLTAASISPGYQPATRTIALGGGDVSGKDFALSADRNACTAPGYRRLYREDFEAGDGGYVASPWTSSFEWGIPTGGPGAAHSGTWVWANDLGGYYGVRDTYLTSPPIDLSWISGRSFYVSWWQWLQTEYGYATASVDVSKDGGATWQLIYGPVDGDVALHWTEEFIYLDPSFAVSNFGLRFRFNSTDPGFLFDWWYIDDAGSRSTRIARRCRAVSWWVPSPTPPRAYPYQAP